MKTRTIRNVGIGLAALWVVGTSGFVIAMLWRNGAHTSFEWSALPALFNFVAGPPLTVWLVVYLFSEVFRWVRAASGPTQKQTTDASPANARRRGAVVVVLILIAAIFAGRHAGPSDTDDFFSCNEQSINTFYAEQARKGVAYDEAAQAGIEAVSNDKCMSAKGYAFTGGGNGECMSARTNECYSRRWSSP